MDGRKSNAASNYATVPRSRASESGNATNEMIPAVTAKLPTLPTVPSFVEVDKVNRQHGGLLGLSQASNLVKGGSTDDVKELLLDSRNKYLEVARSLPDGQADKRAIQEGLPHAFSIYMRSEEAAPLALELIKWFCSAHMICLEQLAYQSSSAVAGWRGAAKGSGAINTEPGNATNKVLRMLLLLTAGFRAFLDNAKSKLFTTENHLKHLEHAVAHARETIKGIVVECSGPNPAVGKAAARLKGLVSTACFTRLHNAAFDNKQPAGAYTLFSWGHKDVSKLLQCLSKEDKGPTAAYLQKPGTCLEALGVLLSVAMEAPQVFPAIASSFAEAVRCMNAASEGTWGERPALQHITVRHSVIACAAHLADRIGKTPDRFRAEAGRQLWLALSDCCIMQTGQYVCDQPPAQGSAGARAIAEARASGIRSGPARASELSITLPSLGEGGGHGALPNKQRVRSPGNNNEVSRTGNISVGNKRPRSPRDHHPGNDSTAAQDSNDRDGKDPTDPAPAKSAPSKRSRSPRSPREHHTEHGSTDDKSTCPQGGGNSTPSVPPGTVPSIRLHSPRSPRERHPHDDSGSTPGIGNNDANGPPPLEPAKTTLNERPEWTEGGRYQVVLGESFERPVSHNRNGASEGNSEVGHYVHLKYDFVPGRTDVDATAMLRQRPLGDTEADKGARAGAGNAGAQAGGGRGGQRWATEIEYGSKHTGSPRPVRFGGHADRAPDLECVLVFDGNMFVMDRVSVIGNMKHVQDVSASPGTGSISLEGAVKNKPKKKEHIGEKAEKRRSKDKTNVSKGSGARGSSSNNSKKDGGKPNERSKNAKKSSQTAENGSATTHLPPTEGSNPTMKIAVAPANMLSKSIANTTTSNAGDKLQLQATESVSDKQKRLDDEKRSAPEKQRAQTPR